MGRTRTKMGGIMFHVKIDTSTELNELNELYSLNNYQQRQFYPCIRFKVVMKSPISMGIVYDIPHELELLIDSSDLDCEEINARLVGTLADVIHVHLTVMRVITERLNSRSIGICLDNEIAAIVLKKMERIREKQELFQCQKTTGYCPDKENK